MTVQEHRAVPRQKPANNDVGGTGGAGVSELIVWFSPAFPTGAFAYSQGLETAVAEDRVTDAAGFENWLHAQTTAGSLWNELALASLIYRASSPQKETERVALAGAMHASSERRDEALAIGAAFRDAYFDGWGPADAHTSRLAPSLYSELAYAAAVGIAARERGLPLDATLQAFASSAQANAVSAGIRLGVLGQRQGQSVLSRLYIATQATVARALLCSEDDLGSSTFAADIACLRHETQHVRLFRS
ncbi:MAG: urease accessory UreF family protein [Pseudomonadota bacterium]